MFSRITFYSSPKVRTPGGKGRKVHVSDQASPSAGAPLPLPDAPDLDWLRKQAKRHRDELRKSNPDAQLADAQFDLAKQYGFSSWRALKAHVDSLTVDGQLFEAARTGDVATLAALLDAHPDRLHARKKPYEWSLLHVAAKEGHLAAVNLLLARGLDVNTREQGDNTYPMHWAAAAGQLDVVRRLADAGGDVIGLGDDHELQVIGWATCWDGSDDANHRAVADFLISRGAQHHIFSAIALNLADEVRRIVAADASVLARQMSHNENYQRPIHFAVRMNRPQMLALLLELGADPLATDGSGYTAAVYAADPDVDRSVMEMLRSSGANDLLTVLALHDWDAIARLQREDRAAFDAGVAHNGALHLMAKRGDIPAVQWLLDHGANPNARWSHWDAAVTPLHLAAWQGHAEIVQLLLRAGADPHIRDSKHDGDAMGWAQHSGRTEIVRLLASP